MDRPRIQFTVGALAVLIALAALNLAAVITAWKTHADFDANLPRSVDHRGRPMVVMTDPDGALHLVAGRSRSGDRLERIVWPLMRPGLLQIASPVVASVSITILVLTVFGSGLTPRNRPAPPLDSQPAEGPSPPGRRWVRWTTIAAGLIGLNLAALAYRSLPDVALWRQGPLGNPYRGVRIANKASFLSQDGRFVLVWSDGRISRPEPGDAEGHILETVFHEPDGSIVSYEGSPGRFRRLFTWPWIIQEPSRSMLESWWPVLAATAITILLLRTLWLQTHSQPDDTTFWFGAD